MKSIHLFYKELLCQEDSKVVLDLPKSLWFSIALSGEALYEMSSCLSFPLSLSTCRWVFWRFVSTECCLDDEALLWKKLVGSAIVVSWIERLTKMPSPSVIFLSCNTGDIQSIFLGTSLKLSSPLLPSVDTDIFASITFSLVDLLYIRLDHPTMFWLFWQKIWVIGLNPNPLRASVYSLWVNMTIIARLNILGCPKSFSPTCRKITAVTQKQYIFWRLAILVKVRVASHYKSLLMNLTIWAVEKSLLVAILFFVVFEEVVTVVDRIFRNRIKWPHGEEPSEEVLRVMQGSKHIICGLSNIVGAISHITVENPRGVYATCYYNKNKEHPIELHAIVDANRLFFNIVCWFAKINEWFKGSHAVFCL